MNQIGLLEQQQELRRMSQQIDFLQGKGRAEAKRRKSYFQLLRRVRRLRKRLLRDLESVRRNLESLICLRVGVRWAKKFSASSLDVD
jgi:hypothetical protein